jgi:hypothetical protein
MYPSTIAITIYLIMYTSIIWIYYYITYIL